jgi:hypothetical protein
MKFAMFRLAYLPEHAWGSRKAMSCPVIMPLTMNRALLAVGDADLPAEQLYAVPLPGRGRVMPLLRLVSLLGDTKPPRLWRAPRCPTPPSRD